MVELSDELSPQLKLFLQQELEAGNNIAEISQDWPRQGSLFILLEKEFIYIIPESKEIQFREINDPHYWKAEYEDIERSQTIACKFN